jgi:hypothetical protein
MKQRLGAVPSFREKDRGVKLPPGVSGGRYAPRSRRDGALEETLTNDGRAADAEAQMNERDALAFAVSHVRTVMPGVRISDREAEDIVQNSLLSTMVTGRLRGAGNGWTRTALTLALRSGVTRALGERDGGRVVDATARRRLRQLVMSEEGVLGRRLARDEVNDLAENLRQEETDLRSKPSERFHETGPEVSLDDPAVRNRAANLPAFPPPVNDTDYLEDELIAGFITPDEARVAIWNHLAARFQVPAAPPNLVAQADADAAADNVRRRGGPFRAAQQWLSVPDGYRDMNDPLFAPWPFANSRDCVAIAELLRDRQKYASGLWVSAWATSRAESPEDVGTGGAPVALV